MNKNIVISNRNPTEDDYKIFYDAYIWINAEEARLYFKSKNSWHPILYNSALNIYHNKNWHTLQDRIPLKGEKLLVQNEDGSTFKWQYGDCGAPDCRCDLRDKKYKVIE